MKSDEQDSVAKETINWRELPLPVIWSVSEAWAGWKELTRPLPVKSFQYEHHDFEMQITSLSTPLVKVTKRCSQVLRSSHQMRLAKLKGELEGLVVSRQTVQNPLDENARLQAALRAAKETNTDPDWIADQEKTLVGWEVREKELKAHIAKLDETTLAKESEMRDLAAIDLNSVEEWSFTMDELV